MNGLWLIVGLLVGTALNGLADDLPPSATGERHGPRWPHCRACNQRYGLLSTVALLGVFFGRGQCAHCGASRPLRHLAVELVTALSWVGVWYWADGVVARFLPAALIVSAFMLIAVIDLEHRLILWAVIAPAALGALLIGWLDPARGWQKTLLGAGAGYGLMALIFLLAQGYMWLAGHMRGEPLTEVALGGGDVNLAGLIGLVVGWSGVVVALLIAIAGGGLFSLAYLIVQSARRRYNPHTPIPYGPFLILGAVVVYFFGANIKAWGG